MVITGANSGIGYPAALELVRHSAEVVLASRDRAKGEAAAARIKQAVPGAKVEFSELDLASLASVRAFADRELARDQPLDLLINNAGVGGLTKRRETKDGFELVFGTNVLPHFALTGMLLPALEHAATAPEARSGGYYGPQGFQETRGRDIGPARIARAARDEQAAARLWQICEELTGIPVLD